MYSGQSRLTTSQRNLLHLASAIVKEIKYKLNKIETRVVGLNQNSNVFNGRIK